MVRFKNRYITFTIDNKNSTAFQFELSSLDVYNEIIRIVTYVHGDVGCSSIKPGLSVKYSNNLTRVGIVRARHGPHRLIISALPLIKKIKDISCTVKLLYTGATLYNCYEALIRHHHLGLSKVLSKLSDEKLKLFEAEFNNFDKEKKKH